MGTITVAGKSIELDEGGFLINHSDWSEEVAKAMAKEDGIELTPEHWEVINIVRERFEVHQYTPNPHTLPKEIGKKLGPEKGNNKYLRKLFPYNPIKQSCKYAGLPWPNYGC